MTVVDMQEAKTHFSRLLTRVEASEEFVVASHTTGRRHDLPIGSLDRVFDLYGVKRLW